jgi:hypothetical protein
MASRARPLRAWLPALAMAGLSLAFAADCRADAAEDAALNLADATPKDAPPVTRAWQFSAEAAALEAQDRAGRWEAGQRVSLDGSVHGPLGEGWQWNFADRLDAFGPDRFAGQQPGVNTFKELYAGGPVGTALTLDVGRINVRYGVAYGWNPTDAFRTDAVRVVSSPDPASLRENRLGTVMLRGQHLWTGGALTAIFAPKLADHPSDDGASLDLGATNRANRWLLAATARVSDDLAPQLLAWRDDSAPAATHVGVDVTHLLGTACVVHLEASAARVASRLDRALGLGSEDRDWRAQAVAGATCTDAWNQSLTLEFQHDGEALDAAGWRALRAGPPADLEAYLLESQRGMDPLTRDQLFAQLRWTNAGIPRLDVSGYVTWSLADHSHASWLEARYHLDRTDLALQWQANVGGADTEHGLEPAHRVLQLLVRHWF